MFFHLLTQSVVEVSDWLWVIIFHALHGLP